MLKIGENNLTDTQCDEINFLQRKQRFFLAISLALIEDNIDKLKAKKVKAKSDIAEQNKIVEEQEEYIKHLSKIADLLKVK